MLVEILHQYKKNTLVGKLYQAMNLLYLQYKKQTKMVGTSLCCAVIYLKEARCLN